METVIFISKVGHLLILEKPTQIQSTKLKSLSMTKKKFRSFNNSMTAFANPKNEVTSLATLYAF